MGKRKGCLPVTAVGKRVSVLFHDHSVNAESAIRCETMGYVERVTDKEIIIRWWSCLEGESEEVEIGDSNNEVLRIIQGTIIRWAICEPRKWVEVE